MLFAVTRIAAHVALSASSREKKTSSVCSKSHAVVYFDRDGG